MRKDTLFLTATTAFATIVALLLWSEVRESKKLIATLRQQVDMRPNAPNGNSARPVASEAQPPSAVITPVPQVAQAESDQASPARASATQYPGCDEAAIASTWQSAETTIAQWAAELQLLPDEEKRLTEARQTELIARLPCASAGGIRVDVNQAQEQFLAALGPARLEQLLNLNAQRNAQLAVGTLSILFREIDKPLRDNQTQQLTSFLLEEHRRTQRETLRTTWPSGPRAHLSYLEADLKLAEERAERILSAAQSFLDPEQLARWRDVLKGSNDRRRSSLESFRKRTEEGEEIGVLLAPISLVRSNP